MTEMILDHYGGAHQTPINWKGVNQEENMARIMNVLPRSHKAMVVNLPSAPIMLALLAVYFIWGSTYLAITYAIESIPPFLMSGMRFMIAGGLLYAYLRLRGQSNPTRIQWRNAMLVGTLMMGVGMGGVTFAEQWVSSGLAALTVSVLPLWAMVFASVVERLPTRFEVFGLALGLIGVVILNIGSDLWGEPIGAIALIIAPMGWSLGSIWSRHMDLPGGLMRPATMLICASVPMLALGLLQGEQITQAPTAESVSALLYLAFFGSVIAFGAYLYLLQNASASVATSYAYVNPIIAVILGSLLTGETVTILTIIAGGFIIGAVMIINLNKSHD